MQPILSVEFSVKVGDEQFKEESVPLHNPEEFFEFIAPGGGCEKIPDEVNEIQMVFMNPKHPNTGNPIADAHVTLQMGMVFFNGPLSEIAHTMEEIVDRSGRGELSPSFLNVIGANR